MNIKLKIIDFEFSPDTDERIKKLKEEIIKIKKDLATYQNLLTKMMIFQISRGLTEALESSLNKAAKLIGQSRQSDKSITVSLKDIRIETDEEE